MACTQSRDVWMVEGLRLALERRGMQTKVRCLYATLRGWIQNAELSVDTRLPSSRVLAHELGVSRNTAIAAVDHLAAEGFLEAREGAGMYVAALHFPKPPPTEAAEHHVSRVQLSRRGQALLSFCAEREPEGHAFTPGVPALDMFPHDRWQRVLRRVRQRTPTVRLDYQTEGGHPDLKASVADYVRLSRGVSCEPDQIIITQGAQQAFDLIARLLADPGNSVWVEEPGYRGAKAAFMAAGLYEVPVPVDDEGIARHVCQSMRPNRV